MKRTMKFMAIYGSGLGMMFASGCAADVLADVLYLVAPLLL